MDGPVMVRLCGCGCCAWPGVALALPMNPGPLRDRFEAAGVDDPHELLVNSADWERIAASVSLAEMAKAGATPAQLLIGLPVAGPDQRRK